jgi:hypothetical protein
MATTKVGAHHFAMFLMTSKFMYEARRTCRTENFSAGYASGSLVLACISNTIPRTPAKRAVAIGMINVMGNIGNGLPQLSPPEISSKHALGIPGTYIWRSKYAPEYKVPFGACLAILGGACISAFALRTYLKHLNKRLDSYEDAVGFELNEKALEYGAVLEKSTIEEAVLRSRGFRYLY